jgi:hypothetical protein
VCNAPSASDFELELTLSEDALLTRVFSPDYPPILPDGMLRNATEDWRGEFGKLGRIPRNNAAEASVLMRS